MPRVNTTCGIYKIENTLDGKFYIGSSHRIEDRFYSHKWELEKQEHHSTLLQRAFDKHGSDNFKFSIILVCSRDNLMFYEQLLLDAYQPYNPKIGYNICKIADRPPIVEFSQERRKQMSEQRKGKQIYKNNPERYAKLLERAALRRGENHHYFGKKMSDERKQKMIDNLKGKPSWNKGKPNTWTPKKRSKEICEKIRIAKNKNRENYKLLKDSDIEKISHLRFNLKLTYQQIADEFNCNRHTISNFVKEKCHGRS